MDDDRTPAFARGERLALLILALALVAITVVVVGRVGDPDAAPIGPVEDRPTPEPHVALPISVKNAYSLAIVWARNWNEDAELLMVSSRFELLDETSSSTPTADGGLILFSFVAPKSGDLWPRASVAVSRQTGTIFYDETTAFAVEPPEPIAERFLTLPISAEQAFRIAEDAVGKSWRAGCESSRRQVQVDLDTTDPSSTSWVVVYYDMRNQGTNDIVVRINAETGELASEMRGEIDCDAAKTSPGIIAYEPAVQRVNFLV